MVSTIFHIFAEQMSLRLFWLAWGVKNCAIACHCTAFPRTYKEPILVDTDVLPLKAIMAEDRGFHGWGILWNSNNSSNAFRRIRILQRLQSTHRYIYTCAARAHTHIYSTVQHSTIHYITLHCITLHYITLPYITLHYTTLHYITLHYITYVYIYIYTYYAYMITHTHIYTHIYIYIYMHIHTYKIIYMYVNIRACIEHAYVQRACWAGSNR